ncbi:MAG: DUF2993 domain-containing protein [Pseudolysinimonas sp.]|uniref:LmeA family phospholipid-binding protein n=1 Tax=Pseudolysinimonas sp. TaxID=2680009 RepID=UPI003264285F
MSGELVAVPPTQPAPAATTVVEARPPMKKRNRALIVVLIIVAILAVLTVIAFLIGENFAKDYAKNYIRTQVIHVLGLPADAKVDVDLHDGSIILQAISGHVNDVDVSVPELAFGPLTGSATLHAENVPLDANAPVGVLRVEFAASETDLAKIAGNLSGLQLDSIKLNEPNIVIASSFTIFGIPVPLGVSILPSAADGQLVFTPDVVTVADQQFAVKDVLANPLFGGFAGDLLKQTSICVAGNLPKALALSSVDVEGPHLVLRFTADGAALGGTELSTMGICGN